MRLLIGGSALAGCCTTAVVAQLAPPPPAVWDTQVALFGSLPERLPARDLSSLKQIVADDVKIYRDGKLVYGTRKDWFEELRDDRRITPGGPQGYSISRDQYFRLADGGISVREFTYPIAPEGEHVVYHPRNPTRYVTYYLDGGMLVRVVYGPAMSSYVGLCQAIQAAKAEAAPNRRRENTDVCG